MQDFASTHEITITNRHGAPLERIEVMLLDGSAYTRTEWDADAPADWTVDDDGNWLFQGRVPRGEGGVEVCRMDQIARTTLSIAGG
jgi:hypothetical protein